MCSSHPSDTVSVARSLSQCLPSRCRYLCLLRKVGSQFCALTRRRWEGSSSSSPSVFTSPVASPESGMLSAFGQSSPTSVCLAPTGTCVSASHPSDRGPLSAWLGCACPVDAFLEGAWDPRSCSPIAAPPWAPDSWCRFTDAPGLLAHVLLFPPGRISLVSVLCDTSLVFVF